VVRTENGEQMTYDDVVDYIQHRGCIDDEVAHELATSTIAQAEKEGAPVTIEFIDEWLNIDDEEIDPDHILDEDE
jgi:hypothetical protein